MKVVNGHSSEVYALNADATTPPRLSILFRLYINDLPINISRSLVNIYRDDITIFRRTSKKISKILRNLQLILLQFFA